ncbi:MAG: C39 family peptidase [Chloroflexi bacterium]|nr:C39 family peptidase [Chloroflexota bacterium]
MNACLYARRRSNRADVRPTLLWFGLTVLLLSGLCVGALIARTVAGEWLELKMESARVRVLEMLPKPDQPDFVSTPMFSNAYVSARSTIAWSANRPTRTATIIAPPTQTTAAVAALRLEQPTLVPNNRQGTRPADQPTNRPADQPTSRPLDYLTSRPPDYPTIRPIQPAMQLGGVVHEAQRFNNCGPTTLRMYLSFYQYTQDTQIEIANVLKPNKDDRNVSPDELVGYARRKGFRALVRVNGDLERLKLLMSNNIPVMIEEGYDPPRAKQGWMGHYLLLTGYDETGITAQDSYNGPNQSVTWQALDGHWRNFNRTYLLVYTDVQAKVIDAILGQDVDDATMYAQAAQRAQDEWNANPNDGFAAFNLGSSLVALGEYEAAAQAFDQARFLKLPWRMMWYQFGPYEAYYRVGRYEEVIALADTTLKPSGDLEESYYYKGLALEKLGRTAEARAAFETALRYNANYQAARRAFAALKP